MSLREFARQVGVSDTAVRKAIKAGRLQKCLGKEANGAEFIADLALAKQEWESTSRRVSAVRTSPAAGSQSGSQAPAATPPAPSTRATAAPTIEDESGAPIGNTLFDAQRVATLELYRKRKLENEVAEGSLVPVDVVRREAFEAERIIRESILNLPARIAGELAAESDAGRVHVRLDAALREALNRAADSLLAEAANA